jgi:hypothetical protein
MSSLLVPYLQETSQKQENSGFSNIKQILHRPAKQDNSIFSGLPVLFPPAEKPATQNIGTFSQIHFLSDEGL